MDRKIKATVCESGCRLMTLNLHHKSRCDVFVLQNNTHRDRKDYDYTKAWLYSRRLRGVSYKLLKRGTAGDDLRSEEESLRNTFFRSQDIPTT